tara:strand:- start:722 stop:1132 length:411 start_codon:yes stop_codon:yes gene_type:complete
VSRNIAKVLDAYLFDKNNVEKDIEISMKEWKKKYKPIQNSNHKYRNYYNVDGHIIYGWFDVYNEEDREHLKSIPANRVWTEVHSSGSFEGIVAGAVAVDRLEYYITEIPWENSGIVVDYHFECKEEYPDCCQDEEE